VNAFGSKACGRFRSGFPMSGHLLFEFRHTVRVLRLPRVQWPKRTRHSLTLYPNWVEHEAW
jgi:hypothetical protein